MKYLMFYKPAGSLEGCPPPSEEHMAAMGGLIEEMMEAGILKETGALYPGSQGASVSLKDGEITVADSLIDGIDGGIGGYAIVEVESKEQAIEMTKRFIKIAGDGVSEMRLMIDFDSPQG